MSILKNIYIRSCFFLASLAIFASCTDDALKPGPDNNPDNDSNYYLTFKIGLQSLGTGTRAGSSPVEEYEDYVDVEKLYIMFFINDDSATEDTGTPPYNRENAYQQYNNYKLYKMFEPGDPAVSMIPVAYNTKDYYDKCWYVKISIPDIKDASGNNVGENFANILRKNDFRVAVMANAETGKKIILEEATYDENKNLILGSDINEIHRQTPSTDIYVNPDLIDFYGFLYEGKVNENKNKYLGYYTDWVTLRNQTDINRKYFLNVNEAAQLIRNIYDPVESSIPYEDYKNMWSVWNFGGDAGDNALTYPTDHLDSWNAVNGSYLYSIMSKALENESSNNIEESFATGPKVPDPDNADKQIDGETVYLEYISFEKNDVFASAVKQESVENYKFYYGIQLPKNQNDEGNNGSNYMKFNPDHGGCFAFKATGSGHLIITASVASQGDVESNNTARILAQIGKKNEHVTYEFNSSSPESKSNSITIEGDSQTIYIYTDSSSESEPVIYQIEYIKDTYLYLTDHQGIAPTKDYPIQMYGVQSYAKLEKLWEEGESFDLDDYHGIGNDYDFPYNPDNTYFHPIPLLRSVAKVIVRIPKSLNARHVYLRSVNRYARWEPTDVKSNTTDIWFDGTEDFKDQHIETCEFWNIVDQPPFFDPTDNPTDAQELSFKQKLAWYYGSWMEQGIIDKQNKIDTKDEKNNFDYPHIMNALVDRTDFVKFLDAGTEEIYDKYVLYVPEKYVDDPDNMFDDNGIEHSVPKVCHVEFRVDGDPDDNLDDNNCYRIYFTEKGFNDKMAIPDMRDDDHSWEKLYEQDKENLQVHWPIIRNHVYQFTVEDIKKQIVIVSLEVLPWKKVDDIKVSW